MAKSMGGRKRDPFTSGEFMDLPESGSFDLEEVRRFLQENADRAGDMGRKLAQCEVIPQGFPPTRAPGKFWEALESAIRLPNERKAFLEAATAAKDEAKIFWEMDACRCQSRMSEEDYMAPFEAREAAAREGLERTPGRIHGVGGILGTPVRNAERDAAGLVSGLEAAEPELPGGKGYEGP